MNTVAEFQTCRRKIFRLAGPWVVIGAIGALVTIFYGKDPSAQLPQNSMLLLVGVFFACILVGASIANRYYRCPACSNVPSRRGILFGASKCHSCGARLK